MRDPAAEVYTQLYMQQYHQFREMAALFYASNRTSDSYFWEARRITQSADDVSPREAFIAAVAGQPPQGNERVVLEKGEAPPDFVEGVAAVESARARRDQEMARLIDSAWANRSPMLDSVPTLANGVELAASRSSATDSSSGAPSSHRPRAHMERQSQCSSRPWPQESTAPAPSEPCSTISYQGVEEQQRIQLLPGLLTALRVLYVDGMISHCERS